MKTILYATDRTDQSVPMLHYAYELSIRFKANLVVLYVHRLPPLRVAVTRRPEHIEFKVVKEQTEILSAFCEKHLGSGTDSGKVRFEVIVKDSILNGILEVSNKLSSDLILIGRKEKYTDRGIFAGDIGQGLLKRSTCPVLIAPNHSNSVSIETVVYATDFEEADIQALKKLVPIAEEVNAKIHVVHIASRELYEGKDRMESFKEMLSDQVDYQNLEFNVIFSDNIVKEIDSYSKSINADIIALLHREDKGFFKNLFNKSVVTQLEDYISIPLLSFNKEG